MNNVLVLGGSYFFGRAFVERLVQEGRHTVYVLNRGNRRLNMKGVHEIVCDRTRRDDLDLAIPPLKWEAVVDFCGYTPRDIANVLSVLPQGCVNQYVFVSTTSVYRDSGNLPVGEDAPKVEEPQPELGPFAEYGYNKWLAEQTLEELCSGQEINYSIVRPAIIYGKYNYAPRESYFFDAVLDGNNLVLPDISLALYTFVSVWDAVEAVHRCLGNSKTFGRALNLAAEELISYRRFGAVVQEVAGREIPIESMSWDTIYSKRLPLPFPLDSHLVYSGRLAAEILGLRYMKFSEGMRRTYEWYANARPERTVT